MDFARNMVNKSQFGVNRICQLTDISKTTYYQAENPIDRFENKYLNIKTKVQKIIKANPAYGVKRIKAELKDKYQIQMGRDTLNKLLKLWRLDLKRKVKRRKPNMIQKILIALADRTNLLIRSKIVKPFQALTSDITELKFKGGRAYFCVHKDSLGQMVYGWSLGLTMETSLVLRSLNMARVKLKKLTKKFRYQLKAKPLQHQDRGTQYTSHIYVKEALEFTTLSYSNPGTPTHNPGQESFFGRFKDEWKTEIAEIETFEELEKFVEQKIKYYNYERRHTSIGLVTPWEHTKMFLKNSR